MAVDCGGFVAARRDGFDYVALQYVQWLRQIDLAWAATFDFPCEPELGLDVPAQRAATTEYAYWFLEQWPEERFPWVVTVQGYTVDDYVRHAEALAPLIFRLRTWTYNHDSYGLDEVEESVLDRWHEQFRVGIGSLCASATSSCSMCPSWPVASSRSSPSSDKVGVLSKVAVRQRLRVQPTRARPVLLVLGPAGERIRAVREALGHERIEIVQWHADPMRYVSAALGLSYLPSGRLYPVGRRAEILLGGIDYPSARGWHDLNLVLASALTSWQLAVESIADSPNWHALELARRDASTAPAELTGRTPKGLLVRVYDLNGLLPFGQIRGVKRDTSARLLEAEIGRVRREDLKVKVLRMDADHGTIFVSERAPHGEQPRLPLF